MVFADRELPGPIRFETTKKELRGVSDDDGAR
jgi:hypothetical protein